MALLQRRCAQVLDEAVLGWVASCAQLLTAWYGFVKWAICALHEFRCVWHIAMCRMRTRNSQGGVHT